MRKILLVLALAALGSAALVACGGDDDGAGVRSLGCDGSASASGSGSSSGSEAASGSEAGSSSACASGSGSSTGLSSSDLGDDAANEVLQDAVDEYRTYVEQQVASTVAVTKQFDDAVRAGDLEGAKALFAPSRVGWESIEPIAALVEEIDGAVDARVDDFESETDPEWTGWHRIEFLLFEQGTTDGAAPFADQLDADLATLQRELPNLRITPLAMARGSAELVEEVSEGKITGEEDRYSHTDLVDIQANIDGSKQIIELLRPALEDADAELVADIDAAFAAVDEILSGYRNADGSFLAYNAETMATPAFKAALAGLSESLAEVPGVLGLK